MDLDSGSWFRACACAKVFYQPNSYSNHVRTCVSHKKSLAESLEGTKGRYARKVKGKKGKEAIDAWYGKDLDINQVPAASVDVSIVVSQGCKGLLNTFDSVGT